MKLLSLAPDRSGVAARAHGLRGGRATQPEGQHLLHEPPVGSGLHSRPIGTLSMEEAVGVAWLPHTSESGGSGTAASESPRHYRVADIMRAK